jgi:hypothetical protein
MACWGNALVFATELTLEDQVVAEDWVTVPVTIVADGGDLPASLQFDLSFDTASFALLDVQVGDAAAQAGKSVVFNESTPGTITVVVAGLNQNTILDGVVAEISFCPLVQGADSYALGFDAVVVSDPFGNPVDVIYESSSHAWENEMEQESASASEQVMPTEQDETSTSDFGETTSVAGAIDDGTTTGNAATNVASAQKSSTRGPLAVFGTRASGAQTGEKAGRRLQASGLPGPTGHANEGARNSAGYPQDSSAFERIGSTDDPQDLTTTSPDSDKELKHANPEDYTSARATHQTGPGSASYGSDTGRHGAKTVTGCVIAFTVAALALVVRSRLR